MAFLRNPRALLVSVALGLLFACEAIQVPVFESDPPGDGGQPPIILGLGGQRPTDPDPSGMGGAESFDSFLLDDFEDGDTKANDPAGWWYIVNDGTGEQLLEIVSAEGLAATGGAGRGLVLGVSSRDFSDWGAAFGMDVGNIVFAGSALEVTFEVAANRPVDLAFHALDGSGAHFTHTLSVSSEWSTKVIRLDQLFVVGQSSVTAFDVATADELQWFVFDSAPTTIWIDDVVLRSW